MTEKVWEKLPSFKEQWPSIKNRLGEIVSENRDLFLPSIESLIKYSVFSNTKEDLKNLEKEIKTL